MSSFETKKLDELCCFINGGAWSDKEYSSSGIPVLKVTNISGNGFSLDTLSYLPLSLKEKYQQNELRLHDVIIATVGSHPNLVTSSAGRSVIVDDTVCGYYLNQNAVCIRTKDDSVLDQLYFGYYTNYYLFKNYIQMRGKGAANQMRIPISAIKEYPMPLPPIDEQKKISGILHNYDLLINNYRKQISLLEETAFRSFEVWFKKDTNLNDGSLSPNDNKEEVSILNSPYFSFVKSAVRPFEGEKTYYATADVNGTYIVKDGVKVTYSNKPSRAQVVPSPNSVWFARMSNSYKILCFAKYNNSRREACILSSGFAGFESDYECFAYMYCLIASKWFDSQKDRYATGATQVSLTNDGLAKIKVSVPAKSLVLSFSKNMNPIIESIIVLREACMKLIDSRNQLLPHLFSGELTSSSK